MEKPLILLSGGFDPYHDGHAKMFMAAAEIGDICVILNSDNWLLKKKGRNFMSVTQRADVLHSVKGVVWVWESLTESDVSKDIEAISRHENFRGRSLIFGKGGDRNATNTPEQAICEKLNIPVIFGLGGNNQQSSSKLLNAWLEEEIDCTGVYKLNGGPAAIPLDFTVNIIQEQRIDG